MKNLLMLTIICLGLMIPVSSHAQLPADAQAAIKKGIMAAKEQEWDIAIQSFQDARKIAPNAPEIFYNLGLAESKIPGRELRAIAWFGAYLAAIPNSPNAAAVNDFIAGLQIKSQGNLNRLIKLIQDTASQITDPYSMQKIAVLKAETGDITGALETADLCQNATYKGLAQVAIAAAQISAGDILGADKTFMIAQKTAESDDSHYTVLDSLAVAQANAGEFMAALRNTELIPDPYWKSIAQMKIAQEQIKIGDMDNAKKTLTTAQKTTDSFLEPTRTKAQKIYCQTEIAKVQVSAGDIAGAKMAAASALNSVDNISNDNDKAIALSQIVAVLTGVGDIADAQNVASRINDHLDIGGSQWKDTALATIANAQLKADDYVSAKITDDLIKGVNFKLPSVSFDKGNRSFLFPNDQVKVSVVKPEAASQAVDKLSDWLSKLDDQSVYDDCALNDKPFLDFPSFLTSQHSDDPNTLVNTLEITAEKIIKAQNIINQMLKQQAKEQSKL